MFSTTSQHQRVMHGISPTNPVRRRLFADESDEARIDNFANVLQEADKRERLEKMQKWNFDFENEVPLEGNIEWLRVDGPNDWIGMSSDTKIDNKIEETEEDDEQNITNQMKINNEATPKSNKDEEPAPSVRKKKREDNNISKDNEVRRRINF